LEHENIEIYRYRTTNRHLEILFRAQGKGNAKVKSREIMDFGWFDLEKMPAGMCSAQKQVIRQVLSNESK